MVYFNSAGKRFLIWMLLVWAVLPGGAQLLSGRIRDASTGLPVGFCNVLLQGAGTGAVADAAGRFKLDLPAGTGAVQLVFSASGYITDTVPVLTGKSIHEVMLLPKPGNLDEVVVTGVSRAMAIRENPVAMVNVSAKAIAISAEPNLIDVLVKNVPGLNAVKTGPNVSKPFIRGLGYNRVLTLYDGIRQEGQQWGDEHGIEADAYNISKAEVIKGPASIMYGSDAVAGVLSLLPSMPERNASGLSLKYTTEYQSNNGLAGNGFMLSYARDKWAYTIRGSYRLAKNYRNSADGPVFNTGFRETNASAALVHYSNAGYSNLHLTLYNNLQGIPDGSRDSLTRHFTRQTTEAALDDVKQRETVPLTDLYSYRLSPLHQHIQHYRIYSNHHYTTGLGALDVLLAFQQNVRREYNHPVMPNQAGMFVRLNTFNYSIRYNAPVVLNTEFSTGINGMYQHNGSKNATDFPLPDFNLLDAGVYAMTKWKYRNWTAGAALRYDRRYLRGNDFYTDTNHITGFNNRVWPPDTPGSYLRFPAFDKNFAGVSLSVGLTWQITGHISLKANLAKGYRAPGITEFVSNGLDPGAHIIYLGNRSFVPEYSIQEDIGADLHYDEWLLSASVFNNHISHFIYLTQIDDTNGTPLADAQGNKTFQYQQAAAQLYGGEMNADFHPRLLKGFSFFNAVSIVYGFKRGNEVKGRGVNGEYLPLIPPLKWISSVSKTFAGKSKTITAVNVKGEMEYSAPQNRYLALNQTETATREYALFHLSVNTNISLGQRHSLQLAGSINNLFDKVYQSHLSRLKYFEYFQASPGSHYGIYNMGRNYCFKVIVSI